VSKSGRTPATESGSGEPPSTQRPPYDPQVYAAASDSAARGGRRSNVPTVPPGPEYEELRDSCAMRVAPLSASDSSPVLEELPSGERFATARHTPAALQAIPQLAIARGDLAWFDLGDDASALINAMNGIDSVARISAVCGVPQDAAQRIFGILAHDGVVEFL
jgi:hypothetical protein